MSSLLHTAICAMQRDGANLVGYSWPQECHGRCGIAGAGIGAEGRSLLYLQGEESDISLLPEMEDPRSSEVEESRDCRPKHGERDGLDERLHHRYLEHRRRTKIGLSGRPHGYLVDTQYYRLGHVQRLTMTAINMLYGVHFFE